MTEMTVPINQTACQIVEVDYSLVSAPCDRCQQAAGLTPGRTSVVLVPRNTPDYPGGDESEQCAPQALAPTTAGAECRRPAAERPTLVLLPPFDCTQGREGVLRPRRQGGAAPARR